LELNEVDHVLCVSVAHQGIRALWSEHRRCLSRVLLNARCGFSVAVNRPYAGTLVPSRYYQKNKRVLGVMIEVNRRLYMDEETGAKNSRFPEIASAIQSLVILLREWHAGCGSQI